MNRKVITERGGRVLENRTTYKGVTVGDNFHLQCLTGYTVECFFKDPVFDTQPMVFGVNEERGTVLMCSVKAITIEEKTKRKRRN